MICDSGPRLEINTSLADLKWRHSSALKLFKDAKVNCMKIVCRNLYARYDSNQDADLILSTEKIGGGGDDDNLQEKEAL
jgi:hypothetical protein